MTSSTTERSWRELASSTLHDYTHFGDQFRGDLEEWSSLLLSDRVRATLGPDFQKTVRREFDHVRKRLDADFTLLVAGDFKRGKSTLINALLGQKVASSNVTPETVTINRFRFAPEIGVSATLENGAKIGLQLEDIQFERLEPILEKLGNPVSFLSVDVPAPWLQGVTIVDTPGMGDVMGRFDKVVHDYLQQADSVIYVVSALSPLSETEERFLRTSLSSHDFPKLTFVVNMIDFAKTSEEEQRLMGRIAPRLQALFPQAQVFAVSALDELCRQVGADRPNLERAPELADNFEGLRDHLELNIFLNRQRIQIDRAMDLTQRLLDRVQENSLRLRSALAQDSAKLILAIEQCEDGSSAIHQKMQRDRDELSQLIATSGEQAVSWMTDFMGRFAQQMPEQLRSCDVESVKKYFPFYLAEVTREALGQCVNAHQTLFDDKLRQMQAGLEADFDALGGSAKGVGDSMANRALWSNFTKQSTFTQIWNFLELSAVLNMITSRSRNDKEMAAYVAGVSASFDEMIASLQPQVSAVYAKLAEQVLADLRSGFELELENASAALRQAQELHAQGASQQEGTAGLLDEVERCCADASQRLDNLEERLWFADIVEL